ncbi:radical SAM protein [Candidatus Bathyarchaeota archaeon]|nr:radical SAM protein [Candidatus Bathyarchaeota archaeon]
MDIRLKLFQLMLRQKILGKGLEGKPLTPQIVSYAVTRACNFACSHCHASAREAMPDELTIEEAKKAVEEMAALGTEVIIFSGGEPLLRKGLILTLTEECMDLGIIPAMLTNGMLLDQQTAARLKDAGMMVVGIPIDYAFPERQDAFRGVRGAFKAAVNAIKACLAVDLKVVVTTMILKNNLNDIPRIVDFLNILGVDQIVLYDLIPVGRGRELSELAISHEQRVKLLDYLYRVHNERDMLFLVSGGNPLYPGALLELHKQDDTKPPDKLLRQFLIQSQVGCHAGIHYFSLRPNGEIYPCPFLQISAGNIRKKSLSEIWRCSALFHQLRDRHRIKGKCGQCPYRSVCGGCRARAYIYTGDLFGEDPLCPIEAFAEMHVSMPAIECFSLCVG